MSSPRRPVDTPPAVLAAASAACCKPEELLHLTPATLAEVLREIKMPLIDRVTVERHLGALRSARPDIAAVQEKAEERKIYPWKVDEERALRLTSRFGAEHAAATAARKSPFESLRATFSANARAGLLGAEHALVLSYLLYSDSTEYGAFMLANLLLNVPADARLSTHNWSLAQYMDSAQRHSLGARIALLDRPLYPPQAAGADTLNAKLLAINSGAGSDPLTADDSLLPRVVGAGFAAVGQLPDGTWAADTTPLEAELRRQVEGMERKLASLGHPPRGPARRQQPQQPAVQYAPQHPASQQQLQYSPQQQQRSRPAQSRQNTRFPVRAGEAPSDDVAASASSASTAPTKRSDPTQGSPSPPGSPGFR
jgi:hypothetical protein